MRRFSYQGSIFWSNRAGLKDVAIGVGGALYVSTKAGSALMAHAMLHNSMFFGNMAEVVRNLFLFLSMSAYVLHDSHVGTQL